MKSKRHRWTKEQLEFVFENENKVSNSKLTKQLNEKFNIELSATAVKSCRNSRKNYIYSSGVKHKYTDEQRTFLSLNVEGNSARELANRFNKRFGTELTESQIRSYRSKNKLQSGTRGIGEGCFKKGNVSTHGFKKGAISYLAVPIGSESVNSDGFVFVKVCDNQDFRNWRLKHHVIWEEHHQKSIPENHTIIFADKNKSNFDIENLLLVTRSQMSTMVNNGLYYEHTELTKAGASIANLQVKLKEKQKDGRK